MPTIGCKIENDINNVLTYNTVSYFKLKQGGDLLTFYTEDWRWSKIIKSSIIFYDIAKNFRYVCMPDYSVYFDEPIIDQLYKIAVAYRVSRRMEEKGIKIIRNIFLTDESIFDVNSCGDYRGDFCVQLQTETTKERLENDIKLINSLNGRKFVYASDSEYNRYISMGLKNCIRIPTHIDKLRLKNNGKKQLKNEARSGENQ